MNAKQTRAKVPPPLKQRLAAAPPVTMIAPDNLSKPSDEVQDLNFKVSPAFHRDFKVTATVRGMSMKELLEASFSAWKEKYGEKSTQTGDLFRG